jgi:DNA mismatch repair protein MutS2
MDQHTLELLEFPKIRELLAGYAATSLGRDLARQLEPMADPAAIQHELALVTEMTESLSARQTPPLGGLKDVRLLVRRATIGSMLTAEELLDVKDALACTGAVYRYRMRLDERHEKLNAMLTRVEDHGPAAKSIEGSLDSRGNVLDMASPELGRVRQQLRELEERAQNVLRRLLRDPELRKILRYPNATVSGDHYVLPVAVNHRHRVPGVVHRTSGSGDTLYIEPTGLASISAEKAVLKTEEDKEVQRVLRRLTAEVARVAKPLQVALDILAHLDLLHAKGRYSLDYRMNEPALNTEGRLWLREARHPLLEYLFRGQRTEDREQKTEVSDQRQMTNDQGHGTNDKGPMTNDRTVVPIDVRLGTEFHLLVITGPNTGGKTVTLKTVGLLSLMALSGMHIPAAQGSAVPLLHHILADIGDEQSLEQSLSTFSSHVSRIAEILRVADQQSLVLLDEMGAGTDPTEGAALGRAILDKLDELGCLAMVTTHLGDLKTYAYSNPRAENAAVEFDVETLRPTYRLHIGQFGMSNALKIARRLRLPKDLLRRAHRYLRKRRRGGLGSLQQAREEAEKARAEALAQQLAAQQQRSEYEQKLAELRREAEKAEALRAARANLQPGDKVRVANIDHPGQIVRIDLKRSLAVVRAGVGQWEVPLEEVFPVT